MQARLKVVQDNANLKQVKLLPITVIGRGADCHLKIASTQVSRRHCRLTVTDNEVLIEDLTSSNGTFVDQERIASGKPIVVAPGSKLQIGPATFIVDYTPPVNLENAPTTVIKAAAMPAAEPPAAPRRGSGGSIPIVDPFSAAVAEGTAPTGRITPYLSPDEPRPDPLENSEGAPPPLAEPAEVVDESEMTLVTPLELNEALRAAPLIIEAAERASVPEAKSAPPTANPAIPPGSSAGSVPASAFDFLGGPSPGDAAPGGYEAFEFGLAAPAARGESTPSTSSSGSKPVASRKPLLGLFGRKKLPVESAKPDAAPPVAVVPVLPASGESAPSNAPATPPQAPQPAPPAADDPFAFLR